MDAGGLAARQQVIQHAVCQRPAVFLRRRMHQHSRGLVHSEKAFIFIKDGKRQWLRVKALRPLLQHDAHPVAGRDRRIGMGGRVVYKQRVLPFEPLDQPGGQAEFPPQERQQLRLPRGCLFKTMCTASFGAIIPCGGRSRKSCATIPPAAGRNDPRSA